MITGYLGCVRIAQVPLEPIHPRLDRSELCFLVSNFLVCALFTLRRFFGSIFKMLACLNFASIRRAFCFLLVLFLFFRGEVQRDTADHFSLGVGEGKDCRSLAIIVLRNVKENCRSEWRVIPGIRRPSLVGVRKPIVVS